jgi:hypothetical protein
MGRGEGRSGATAQRSRTKSPEASCFRIELHTERGGLQDYAYRRVTIERTGERAAVRELSLTMAWDDELILSTRPRDLVRVRGRALALEEADTLWRRVRLLRPERLAGAVPCLDHLDPARLDPTVGLDGRPIAVSLGEEGPACLTLGWGAGARARRKRIVVDRFRPPPREVRVDGVAPITRLVSLVEHTLAAAPLRSRRQRPVLALGREFDALRAVCFLNLEQLERRGVEALGALGDGRAVPALTRELFAQDAAVRLQALDALAAIGDGSAADEVALLYDADETPVREKARHVLGLLRR